jgi:uncharacterized protein YciI
MGLYLYVGRDSARGAELRPAARPKHLTHLEQLDEAGRIRFAGPLLDENDAPCGSLIVFEAVNLEEARRVAEGDPYLSEGVFDAVEVFATKAVFPR